MFDLQQFKALNFKKSVIEDIRLWCTGDNTYTSLGIDGKFFDNPECPYFTFSVDLFPDEFNNPGKIAGAEILSFDISFSENDERYSVKLAYIFGVERGEMDFPGKKASLSLLKYRGMSYRNMYDIRLNELEKSAYVECADYFKDEETYELEDGFSLNVKSYADIEEKSPQYKVMKASLERCVLSKNGEPVYRWANTDSSNPHEFFDFIHHSNGRRYFPFHIGLYGISYLDLDSGEVYHYIPEGYQHNSQWTFGESFIIVGVHYDKDTDLVAYHGCYWGGPYVVMVGDLSKPLSYDPHLVDIHDIIDPDWEKIDEIDFARFENGCLVVKDMDKDLEMSVSCTELLDKIKMAGRKS